jgi:hypothetical protein
MTFSPELISMVRSAFPDDTIIAGLAESGDKQLLVLLREVRPSPDAVLLAEAILEYGGTIGAIECAEGIMRRLTMCDLCV